MEGAISLRVCIFGKEHWASNIGDLVIHPDYRKQGLTRRIIEQLYTDNPMSISWANKISRRVPGPLSSSRIARHIRGKPLDFAQISQKLTGNQSLSHCVGVVVSSLRYLTRPLRRQPAHAGVTISQVDTFDQRVDALWKRVCRDYPVIVVRDLLYLNWRFTDRPDAKYTVLVATRGFDLVGYLVFRSSEKAGLRIGYLVDFLVEGRSSSLLALLVEEAVGCLRREGVGVISCRATNPSYRRVLYRQGFYPWPWVQPRYFHPRTDLLDTTLQVFRDTRKWFLTMGDGDLEMAF